MVMLRGGGALRAVVTDAEVLDDNSYALKSIVWSPSPARLKVGEIRQFMYC